MRFKAFEERRDHWPFEGLNYALQMNSDDLTVGLEVTMMDWLEERKISHAWTYENRITFKNEKDRLMFVLRFQ